ncbi:MAG: hypothetical protein LUI01_05670 [Firmicutes bacterium]|nr:hypothetical protein [Bacillota bacterium]
MGLGILFVGYVLSAIYTLSKIFFVTDLIGCFAMYTAVERLKPYAKKFRYAAVAVIVEFIQAALQCVYYVMTNLVGFEGVDAVETSLELLRIASLAATTITLLLALRELALSVGDVKLGDDAVRNIWIYGTSIALSVVLSLEIDALADFQSAFSAIGYVYKLLAAALVCVYIFRCYMWICFEEDHDMTKRSKLDRMLIPGKKRREKEVNDPIEKPAENTAPTYVKKKKKKKK